MIKPPGNEYFVINPLPKRFNKRSSEPPAHIIVRKHVNEFYSALSSEKLSNSFCGLRREDVLPRKASLRYGRSITAPVHVETAVFIDNDMFRLMANNFPEDTEREVVRFVLAMVNAVSISVFYYFHSFMENIKNMLASFFCARSFIAFS